MITIKKSGKGFTPYHFSSAKSDKGFTLIELLVVIAIIGILSSVVLASLNSARVRSRDARRLADMNQLKTALELYNASNNTYPAALSSVAPTHIQIVPTDPRTAGSYGYVQLSSGGSYVLGATLETTHSILSSDYDGAQAITIGGTATNCNALAGNPGANERVLCVRP